MLFFMLVSSVPADPGALTDTMIVSSGSTSTSSPFLRGSGIRSYPDVNIMSGNTARLPCNIETETTGPLVNLIFWYKSGNGTGPPIYTVDARNSSNSMSMSSMNSQQQLRGSSSKSILLRSTHFIASDWKERVSFNLTSRPPTLVIHGVRKEDTSDYSCRVSTRLCLHVLFVEYRVDLVMQI